MKAATDAPEAEAPQGPLQTPVDVRSQGLGTVENTCVFLGRMSRDTFDRHVRRHVAVKHVGSRPYIVAPSIEAYRARSCPAARRDNPGKCARKSRLSHPTGDHFRSQAKAAARRPLRLGEKSDTRRAMSRENVELARRVFDLFNSRELAAFFDSFHPELTYRNREDEPDVRTCRGVVEYREYVGRWLDMFEDLRFEDLALDDVADYVIATADLCGRGRDTGAHVRGRYVFLLQFRDGLILRGHEYATRREALEAVGLSK